MAKPDRHRPVDGDCGHHDLEKSMPSKIEWTDETWQVVSGCTPISPGCRNCYSAELAGTRLKNHPRCAGLARKTEDGRHVFNGEVRLNPDQLGRPMRWTKPRKIFVADRGDLFHQDVPFGFVMRIFYVAGHANQHTYQFLTKRPQNLLAFLKKWADLSGESEDPKLVRGPSYVREAHLSGRGQLFADMLDAMGEPPPGHAHPLFDWKEGMRWWPQAIPNFWFGCSIEDQERADERRSVMAEIAALGWNTFVSYEPALGPVVWTGWEFLKWMISGGESGAHARPSHPGWFQRTRDWCAVNGIAYLHKQNGEWKPFRAARPDDLFDARKEVILGVNGSRSSGLLPYGPDAFVMQRVGKKLAGRLLDGVIHDAYP